LGKHIAGVAVANRVRKFDAGRYPPLVDVIAQFDQLSRP
jgi:hypothetical protein